MVIIAAGSSLISVQKGWSPFSCSIIAKPLTWNRINKPAGFSLLLWMSTTGGEKKILHSGYWIPQKSNILNSLDKNVICDELIVRRINYVQKAKKIMGMDE